MTVIKVRFKRNFALVALHDFSSVKSVALRNILNARKHNRSRSALIDELGDKFFNLTKRTRCFALNQPIHKLLNYAIMIAS